MTFTEFAREIAYPLTQPVMLIALVFFWLLLIIATKAGLLGLFLLLLAIPAYLRYLLAILESRAHGKEPEPPTGEMFSLVDSAWSLFPLVPVAILVWLEFAIAAKADAGVQGAGIILAGLPRLLFALLMPASLAVLTLTRSPLASIKPGLLLAVIRRSLPGYLLIPLVAVAVSAVLFGLRRAGVPDFLLDFAQSYQLFLLCSLTGAILHRRGMHFEVDIPESLEPDQPSLDRKQLDERRAVANHAYGFISRGNRAGGLKHVQQRIDEEADVDGAWRWFFDEMMRWESSDAALYFAQNYLSRLLRLDEDAGAIRLVTRCLHREPRFRPLEQDRQLTAQLLQKHGRKDLLQQLGIEAP